VTSTDNQSKSGYQNGSFFWHRRKIDFLSFFGLRELPAGTHYYNETGNDRWIAEYIFPGIKEGFFLEAGAANGKEASSCYVLEKELGWTGICIEPHDDFFKRLVQNRPNSTCVNKCLSNQLEEVLFVEGDDKTVSPYLSGIKSISQRH
jgi:hypothetical protein